MKKVSHDWLVAGILLSFAFGGAFGFWYGIMQGKDIGYKHAQADVIIDLSRKEKQRAEALNPFKDTTTNPFAEVKTNPYDHVKLNPFE
jgi:hypothetical protein